MKSKKIVKQKLLVVCAFFLGISISMYIKILNPNRVYIPLREIEKIENEINYRKIENSKLETLLNEYRDSLHEYQNSEKSTFEIMKSELYILKTSFGDISMEGEGIEIIIKDSDRDLKKNQNPNDLLVHDIDILKIVNDLKKSSSKAISINGERLISTSEIKCSGATISINGNTYGQPFIIKVIGDPELLKAALVSPTSYANLLKESYGIFISIEEKDNIFVNSYKNMHKKLE
ncbi:MAG: DUF881 domain-containing protein [Paraclostridium sp.]